MSDRLLSVGLDVGTTSTQMVVSAITVENRASGFAVPEMAITDRQILYKSPVHFTPLRSHALVDGEGLLKLVEQEYRNAGITRQQVDTGAVIITGETSRKENAGTVLQALSGIAGEFVVATAGPDLESILAAKGAGAVDFSAQSGKTVLHMDIGGGTSNLALIRDGQVVRTGCLNVGGRLLKFDAQGKITYKSPVLEGICPVSVGQTPAKEQTGQLAKRLCQALESAAGLCREDAAAAFYTKEVQSRWIPPEETVVLSFSGGVAECIEHPYPPREFGDLGPELGAAIRQSSLCAQPYRIGTDAIRATVIGAGCHSTQLSGSTVFCKDVRLPKKNLPVLCFTRQEQQSEELSKLICAKLAARDDGETVLAFPGSEAPEYAQVTALAQRIVRGVGDRPVYVCLEGDMAKALGQCICLLLPDRPCLCLDRLKFGPESYLDVAAPVGPCYPVVVKTLVLSSQS